MLRCMTAAMATFTHAVNCYRHAELLLTSTSIEQSQAPKRGACAFSRTKKHKAVIHRLT